ncbi:MAG: hypothetical protein ABIK96_12870 [bacterium]
MSSVQNYFALLRDWKQLPAYRAEPRVDSIIGFALPEILLHDRDERVTFVIPELPLRIGSVQPEHEGKSFSNKSYKVDFFVMTEGGKNYLVEFKTDSGSRREKQDEYLEAARDVRLGAVVEGILNLYQATTYKKKYRYLLAKLEEAGLVSSDSAGYAASVADDRLHVLYVQPHAKENDAGRDVLDFVAVAEALTERFGGDEFMTAAAHAFLAWAED